MESILMIFIDSYCGGHVEAGIWKGFAIGQGGDIANRRKDVCSAIAGLKT